MTRTWKWYAKWASIVIVLAGPVIGPVALFQKVGTSFVFDGASMQIECGSVTDPLRPPETALVRFPVTDLEARDACVSRLQDQRIVAIVWVIAGVAGWVIVLRNLRQRRGGPESSRLPAQASAS